VPRPAAVARGRLEAIGPGGAKASADVKRDGTFRLLRLVPGRWRLTVVAAGFDKISPAADNRFESRLSRLLEEPVRTGAREEAALPSLLQDDDADVFTAEDAPASVSFDAEEDLDIPDFLKS